MSTAGYPPFEPTDERPLKFSAGIEAGPHREGKPDQWAVFEHVGKHGFYLIQRCRDRVEAEAIAAEKNGNV